MLWSAGGLSAVAEVSALHRLLGQESFAGRAVREGCRHRVALCAAVSSVCGALSVMAMGGHQSFAGRLALVA